MILSTNVACPLFARVREFSLRKPKSFEWAPHRRYSIADRSHGINSEIDSSLQNAEFPKKIRLVEKPPFIGMLIRISKLLVLFGTSLLFLLITFGNISNPSPNQTFAQHVVSMDTVSEKSLVVQRAIAQPWAGQTFFISIVAWETTVTILCFSGLFFCVRTLRSPGDAFQKAKGCALLGLSLAMLLWVGGFLGVGGEWFSMWLSPQWNGQNSAGRMALVTGVALLFLERPDTDL